MSHAPAVLKKNEGLRAAANRLGIAHFLLWLAATAPVLAAFRPVLSNGESLLRGGGQRFPSHEHFAAFIAIATSAPICGAALAGFGLAGWRCLFGGIPFPSHPGHWLLLVVGSGVVALLPFPELVRFSGANEDVRRSLLAIAPCAGLVVSLGILIVATVRLRSSSPWQPLFLALAISCGVMLIGLVWDAARLRLHEQNEFVLALLGFAWSMVFVFALAVRSIIDLCEERRYDALHWVGTALLPAHLLWLIVWIWMGGNTA
jgi:hypothetical protein